jgi:hypothetical protein
VSKNEVKTFRQDEQDSQDGIRPVFHPFSRDIWLILLILSKHLWDECESKIKNVEPIAAYRERCSALSASCFMLETCSLAAGAQGSWSIERQRLCATIVPRINRR